jgi:hypothetical protein
VFGIFAISILCGANGSASKDCPVGTVINGNCCACGQTSADACTHWQGPGACCDGMCNDKTCAKVVISFYVIAGLMWVNLSFLCVLSSSAKKNLPLPQHLNGAAMSGLTPHNANQPKLASILNQTAQLHAPNPLRSLHHHQPHHQPRHLRPQHLPQVQSGVVTNGQALRSVKVPPMVTLQKPTVILHAGQHQHHHQHQLLPQQHPSGPATSGQNLHNANLHFLDSPPKLIVMQRARYANTRCNCRGCSARVLCLCEMRDVTGISQLPLALTLTLTLTLLAAACCLL